MNWRALLSARWQPPAAGAGPRPRDAALEALRGICALLVFYAHVFVPGPTVDPVYVPSLRFWWFNLGQAAVLMFFVLSGYVIGLTTMQPFNRPAAGRYLLRRAARLVPVTYAAILLSWLFLPATDLSTLASNALFLQNDAPYPLVGWHFPVLANNAALWTLNFEVFYYLLFIAVWWRAPSAVVVLGLVAFVPLGRALDLPLPVMLSRYACGACYWLGGLALAWMTRPAAADQVRRSHWPSALLCAYAIWSLGGLRSLLFDAQLLSLLDASVVAPHRLDFLPVCLWCVLAVTGRAPRAQIWLAAGCLSWGWLGLARSLATGHTQDFDLVPDSALVVASALMFWRPAVAALGRLAPLGAVSFGVYALASPLQIAQKELCPGFSGTAATYAVRVVLLLGITVGLAWLIDYRLNRWLAHRLGKK